MSENLENRLASRYFTQAATLLGVVTKVDLADATFDVRCRNGGEVRAKAGAETKFTSLSNVDNIDCDRIPKSPRVQFFQALGAGSQIYPRGRDAIH